MTNPLDTECKAPRVGQLLMAVTCQGIDHSRKGELQASFAIVRITFVDGTLISMFGERTGTNHTLTLGRVELFEVPEMGKISETLQAVVTRRRNRCASTALTCAAAALKPGYVNPYVFPMEFAQERIAYAQALMAPQELHTTSTLPEA